MASYPQVDHCAHDAPHGLREHLGTGLGYALDSSTLLSHT